MLHRALLFTVLATAAVTAEEVSPKQKVLDAAKRYHLDVHLDQPYAGTSNPKQCVDLYLPQQRKTDKPLPVIALIHGGGWINGDRIGYSATAIKIAATGNYAAVAVGYRLTNEAHWPEQAYDCKAAIRWIRGHAKEFNLDPDHIGAMGSSAGGHLVSFLGTSGDVKAVEGTLGDFATLSSRVQAVANQCGPEDFTKALMFDKEGKPIVKDAAVIGLLGGTYEEKHDIAVAASPLTYVTKDDPPFITFHGNADQRVAFANAETIHAALQKAGVPSALIPIKGGAHGSVRHPQVFERAMIFFDAQLRGQDVKPETTPLEALPEPAK